MKWLNKSYIKVFYNLLVILSMLVTAGFAWYKQSVKPCSALNIHIDESEGNYFLNSEDIEKKVGTLYDSIQRVTVASIDLDQLEATILGIPEVKTAKVFKTLSGNLHVSLTQRNPIARVITRNTSSYYIDEAGIRMPLSRNYSAKTLIFNGYILDKNAPNSYFKATKNDSIQQQTLFDEIFQMANYIHQDEFWKAQIQQIYVNENQEFELIPRVGNHIIEFGKAVNINTKFKKLMVLYKEGFPYTNWNDYSTINLKFKNQVVCTKK